jgi:hypothetical protein
MTGAVGDTISKRPTDGKPWPPEVTFDYHWNQVVARRDDGSYFPQYVECGGCGWLIGCGDAIDSIWHNSCHEREFGVGQSGANNDPAQRDIRPDENVR